MNIALVILQRMFKLGLLIVHSVSDCDLDLVTLCNDGNVCDETEYSYLTKSTSYEKRPFLFYCIWFLLLHKL